MLIEHSTGTVNIHQIVEKISTLSEAILCLVSYLNKVRIKSNAIGRGDDLIITVFQTQGPRAHGFPEDSYSIMIVLTFYKKKHA